MANEREGGWLAVGPRAADFLAAAAPMACGNPLAVDSLAVGPWATDLDSFDRSWPISPEFAEASDKFGASFARIWPGLNRMWPPFYRIRGGVDRLRPDLDRVRPEFGRVWPGSEQM